MKITNKIDTTPTARYLWLVLLLPICASSQTIEIPLSQPGQRASIEIELVHGSIEVIGEDRENVIIEVDNSSDKGGRRIVTPSGTKTIPLSSYAIEAAEDDNRVSISSDWRSQGMTVRARVPQQSDLDLSSVHAGEVSVERVNGRLELSNVHGGITAHNINGTVVAETVHGPISVTLNQVQSEKPMAFSTVHGDISLAFPSNFGADIAIDSRQSEIYSDFDVEVKPSDPQIKRGKHRRGVKFELEQILHLSINGGGTPVRIETLHGEISLHKAER